MKQNPVRSKILALGSSFPDNVLTNFDIEKLVDTSDAWIRERSGIIERRRVKPGESNSDLAARASLKALEKAGLAPTDIDMIINCTNSPDKLLPAMACVVQAKIGASPNGCVAFDLVGACAGWVIGMSVADQYIRTGMYKNILVIGAEAITRYIDWQDRSTCVLFGDGAGATIVSATEDPERSLICSTHMHSDGRFGEILEMPAGGSDRPVDHEVVDQRLNHIKMKGTDVFKHAVRDMAEVAIEALKENNLSLEDVDWFIPHQANIRIIEAVAKKLNFPMEKVLMNVQKYGNTSAATIPTAFDEFVDRGVIKRGHTVLMATFGGGLTWASMLVKY